MAKSGTKIKRISAKSEPRIAKQADAQPKISKYAAKVAGVKPKAARKPLPKFLRILLWPLKPFAKLGRYFVESWRELKLVRWPNRRESWKMTGSVIAFAIAFAVAVMLIDGLFDWIFKIILAK